MKKTLTALLVAGVATMMSAVELPKDMPKCTDKEVQEAHFKVPSIAQMNETSTKYGNKQYRALDLANGVETEKGYSKEELAHYRICRYRQIFRDMVTHKKTSNDSRTVLALIAKKDGGEVQILFNFY